MVGSWSFSLSLFRSRLYIVPIFLGSLGNNRSFCLMSCLVMYCFSMSRVVALSLSVLPMVCFAPVMLTTPLFRSMSLTCSHVSSTGRVPKSLDMDRNSDILGLAFAIIRFIFSVAGIFGNLS